MATALFRNLVFALLLVCAASCDNGGGAKDAVEDEGVEAETRDLPSDPGRDETTVDPAPDEAAPDPTPDPTDDDDGPADPSGEEAEALIDPVDEDLAEQPDADIAPDPAEDDLDAADAGEQTRCERGGGYCSGYPVLMHPCMKCEQEGYRPAPPGDSAQECTVSGIGAVPWCCVPAPGGSTACEVNEGECYPSGGGNVCPIGWDLMTEHACSGGDTCCVPGIYCL